MNEAIVARRLQKQRHNGQRLLTQTGVPSKRKKIPMSPPDSPWPCGCFPMLVSFEEDEDAISLGRPASTNAPGGIRPYRPPPGGVPMETSVVLQQQSAAHRASSPIPNNNPNNNACMMMSPPQYRGQSGERLVDHSTPPRCCASLRRLAVWPASPLP